ncbi:MAG TPA: pyridoxal-phosphate dependent enzyme, partial [Bacteroidales bacterium]|nr:pyridoxal-phosphate dependent enzyme [Bacteroidales bacterium]
MYEKMKAEMMAGSEIKATGYFSTNLSAPKVSFEEALLRGLAPDKGLYMPEHIPTIDEQQQAAFHGMAYYEIAAHVLSAFLGETIPFADLTAMCRDAYTFDVPLEPAGDNLFILRLDQGPTASFKDFAARLMARMMNYFMAKEKRHLVILTATSGDTGSAVANAFYGLEHIDVVVLFPLREVSEVQRRQMTTLHGNVHIAGIDGKFDHCQALVKQAFTDKDLARIP